MPPHPLRASLGLSRFSHRGERWRNRYDRPYLHEMQRNSDGWDLLPSAGGMAWPPATGWRFGQLGAGSPDPFLTASPPTEKFAVQYAPAHHPQIKILSAPRDSGFACHRGGTAVAPAVHMKERALSRLRAAMSYWLATTRPDGRPHSMPVYGVVIGNEFWFGTMGQKSRNLRHLSPTPFCTTKAPMTWPSSRVSFSDWP